jgi:peptide-methionine (S)-S-oxide reductase
VEDTLRAGEGGPRLADLFARLPDGYSVAWRGGRRYGVTKTGFPDGRSWKLYAEELGGTVVVSANLYLTDGGEVLRPCEMPREKVIEFLEGSSAGTA